MAVHFSDSKIPSSHTSVTESAKYLIKALLHFSVVERISLGTMTRTGKSCSAGRRAKFLPVPYSSRSFKIIFLSGHSKQDFLIQCKSEEGVYAAQRMLLDTFPSHKKRGIRFSGEIPLNADV